MRFGRFIPALLTRICMGPSRATPAVTAAESVTSTTQGVACPPCARTRAHTSLTSALLRAATATWAPASASAITAACPMPLLPPVTSARRPSTLKLGVFTLLPHDATMGAAPGRVTRGGIMHLRAWHTQTRRRPRHCVRLYCRLRQGTHPLEPSDPAGHVTQAQALTRRLLALLCARPDHSPCLRLAADAIR